jgi:hypothetical protein
MNKIVSPNSTRENIFSGFKYVIVFGVLAGGCSLFTTIGIIVAIVDYYKG